MILIVVPPKRVDLLLRVLERREPMHVQTFLPEPPVERFVGGILPLQGRSAPCQCPRRPANWASKPRPRPARGGNAWEREGGLAAGLCSIHRYGELRCSIGVKAKNEAGKKMKGTAQVRATISFPPEVYETLEGIGRLTAPRAGLFHKRAVNPGVFRRVNTTDITK